MTICFQNQNLTGTVWLFNRAVMMQPSNLSNNRDPIFIDIRDEVTIDQCDMGKPDYVHIWYQSKYSHVELRDFYRNATIIRRENYIIGQYMMGAKSKASSITIDGAYSFLEEQLGYNTYDSYGNNLSLPASTKDLLLFSCHVPSFPEILRYSEFLTDIPFTHLWHTAIKMDNIPFMLEIPCAHGGYLYLIDGTNSYAFTLFMTMNGIGSAWGRAELLRDINE